MTDMTPIADEAATRLAFGLLRRAYLDLAQQLMRIEPEPARELLHSVEHRIVDGLGSLTLGISGGAPQETPLAVAASQVRSVLREARGA